RGDGRSRPLRQALPGLRLDRSADRLRGERIQLLREMPDRRKAPGRSRPLAAAPRRVAEDARGTGGEEGSRSRYITSAEASELEPSILDRLSAHRLLAGAPPDQLAWLAARGRLIQLETGHVLTAKSGQVLGLYIVLSGHLSIHVDRGAGPHKVMEWRGGDVTGLLPYSRLVAPPGDVKAEVPSELLLIPREEIPALIRDCYDLTSIFVHVMIDRARHFTSSDLQEEKLSSL